jgi:hypothetical protein
LRSSVCTSGSGATGCPVSGTLGLATGAGAGLGVGVGVGADVLDLHAPSIANANIQPADRFALIVELLAFTHSESH